jgi:hypothetical protein
VKYRMLLLLPVFAALALVGALALTPAADHSRIYLIEVELAKACSLVGCMAAALRFGRGDYLRGAWLLQAQCYVLILAKDFLQHSFAPSPRIAIASGLLILVGNAGQLVGTVMIARVWRVAGFDLASSTAKRIVVAIAVAIGIIAGGYMSLTSLRSVMSGNLSDLVHFVSSVADIVSFALIAPFLITALALRGGSLAWTWGLLTASLLGWLLFDATLSFAPLFMSSSTHVHLVSELFRVTACAFGMGAGLAQYWAISRSRTAR